MIIVLNFDQNSFSSAILSSSSKSTVYTNGLKPPNNHNTPFLNWILFSIVEQKQQLDKSMNYWVIFYRGVWAILSRMLVWILPINESGFLYAVCDCVCI